jgi:LacI family transcriptional regulator
MMNAKRMTVKEIARRAGVSIGTVDRVIHGRGEVAAATKARIEAIIEADGYTPDVLARHLKLNRRWSIRVLMPRGDQDSGYWRLCREGIEAAASGLADFRVSVRFEEFDRYDRSAFSRLLRPTPADRADGLLIAPVIPEELLPALGRMEPAIPYAFFDGLIEGARPVASLGQDPWRAGRLAGRMLSLLAHGDAPLVAINAHAEDGHIRRRIEGFSSYFETAPAQSKRELLVRQCLDLERADLRESFLSGLFGERPDMGGILVANASGHLVGNWLAARGRKADCALVSWDLVPANASGLRSGSIDCVISQRPQDQGRLGLERLFKAVAYGEDVSEKVDLPIDIWLKENVPAASGKERGEEHGAAEG